MTRTAYLISEYPAPSHTFIRREIAALRELGLSIYPVSVRPGTTATNENVPAILGRGWLNCLVSAIAAVLSSPVRGFSTAILAQRHRVAGLRGLLWAQFHLVEALTLARILKGANVDRLHSHFANSGATVGLLAAHFLRIPWSLTLHGISETDPPAGQLLPEKLLRAEFVACASWFMRAQAMRVTPSENWHKYHIVRCGVFLRPSEKVIVDSAARRVQYIAVGRLSPEKGYVGLISAFADVIARGLDAELTIVGDGPLLASLRRHIREAELCERIRLAGALPEEATLKEISNCDILVLPSLMEGLPVVLMEAMGLEKAVIAPAVAGIPELVTHGETGLLFRPGDWSQLTERMGMLGADKSLQRRLGKQGRLIVENEFEIHKAVEPLIALFASR